MTKDSFYKDHWTEIESARFDRYDRMFQWNPESKPLFEPADIQPGQTVADFGCGPGHTAIELAGWVGCEGHVHALDINAAFIDRAREHIASTGLGDRITVHHLTSDVLPLDDCCLDRVVARNTLIYVDDPLQCLQEFRRVLKPGGKAHAIEGDWPMMVVEPVPTKDWCSLADAAGYACRTPDIGRKLYGIARAAGYSHVTVEVITRPDREGRLLGMIDNMANYARQSGKLPDSRIDAILATVKAALETKTFLAVAPQFVVTATV
ncbi:MAG: methyltransferase domain-containing protein [Alphaproteobacteria bacterium]|nr:methyltransferase domain-containing protein [Alphaproteobacteria bacterium]